MSLALTETEKRKLWYTLSELTLVNHLKNVDIHVSLKHTNMGYYNNVVELHKKYFPEGFHGLNDLL